MLKVETCACWRSNYSIIIFLSLQWRRQGGAQPPNELKNHHCEKMKSEEKLRGGGDDYVQSSNVRSFSANSHPEKARNRICGTLDFKIFRGSRPPDPPRIACAFGARILPPPETMTPTTPLFLCLGCLPEVVYLSQAKTMTDLTLGKHLIFSFGILGFFLET